METVKEVFEALGTGEKGLSSEEAEKRLAKYGKNTLTTIVKTPQWLQILLQFKDVLVIILIVAGIISLAIGDLRDSPSCSLSSSSMPVSVISSHINA
jgi:Ca2+-transporting ATPase